MFSNVKFYECNVYQNRMAFDLWNTYNIAKRKKYCFKNVSEIKWFSANEPNTYNSYLHLVGNQ